MPDSLPEIISMVHRYCELFDTGQLDEFAAQFEHGQWHRAGPGAEAARRWIDDQIAERIQTYIWRDGNRAVVAR